MNHDAILAVLPDSKDDALSLKEIAQALGLEMNSYVDWIRAERRLASSLRALARWGWVASDRRQNEDGHRFWYNAYWKTEPAEAKAAYDPPRILRPPLLSSPPASAPPLPQPGPS